MSYGLFLVVAQKLRSGRFAYQLRMHDRPATYCSSVSVKKELRNRKHHWLTFYDKKINKLRLRDMVILLTNERTRARLTLNLRFLNNYMKSKEYK